MSSAISAVEQAVYDALATGIDGATVYQDVPENEPAPLVILGDIEGAQQIGYGDDPDRRVPLTIIVITEGDERDPCSKLVGQVETLLNGRSLSVSGWTIAPTLEASSAILSESGDGYTGLVQFTVLALAD